MDMQFRDQYQMFMRHWNTNTALLVLFNMLGGVTLIVLSFTRAFPLDPVNFIFFSFVGLLFALYRPGWAFLLLIGMLPYENINIAPYGWDIALRPYQWWLVLVAVALSIRFMLRRTTLEQYRITRFDVLLIIVGVSSFVSSSVSLHPLVSLKQSIILASFLLLYFVCRLFVRSWADVRTILPFLFSSFMVIVSYAIAQNILFLHGWENLEVMAGRPNATFTEADWLGGYVAAMVAGLCAVIVSLTGEKGIFGPIRYGVAVMIGAGLVALILSVSRSAWLAAGMGIASALVLLGWRSGIWQVWKAREKDRLWGIIQTKLFIFVPLLFSVAIVSGFGLTSFDIFDRGKSVTTGEQRITVACVRPILLPEKISALDELEKYGCQHIRLEEMAIQEEAGAFVTSVYRTDPNVKMRNEIYKKGVSLVEDQWLWGIGFGSIAPLLGTDGRGAGLNGSNIFLEVWLGTGIIGFFVFVIFWLGLGGRLLLSAFSQHSGLGLIFGSVWVTVTVFNIFNAGLFLGWFFLLAALFSLGESKKQEPLVVQ